MKRLASLLFVFLLWSCIQDPILRTEPDRPTVSYSNGSSSDELVLTGYFEDSPGIVEYGFELSKNSFGDSSLIIRNPARAENGIFRAVVQVERNNRYVCRSYISNGVDTMYSNSCKIRINDVSSPVRLNIQLEGETIIARVLDDGGKAINEVGFEADKMMIPVSMGPDHSFSLAVQDMINRLGIEASLNSNIRVRAYVENSQDALCECYTYSDMLDVSGFNMDMSVSISDAKFADYLRNNYDTNKDGQLSYRELAAIAELEIDTYEIASIIEIKHMPNLQRLTCRCREELVIDLSPHGLTTLDVSGNPLLTTLFCESNQLQSLDVSMCYSLDTLCCQGNGLKHLSLNSALHYLDCSYNYLESVDKDTLDNLRYLCCENNKINQINPGMFMSLEYLDCRNNSIGRAMTVSKNASLSELHCENNNLAVIFMKKGQVIPIFTYDFGVEIVEE